MVGTIVSQVSVVAPAVRSERRTRELEDHVAPARLEHAMDLAEVGFAIGQVAHAESYGDDVETLIVKGQVLGIGKLERELGRARVVLAPSPRRSRASRARSRCR